MDEFRSSVTCSGCLIIAAGTKLSGRNSLRQSTNHICITMWASNLKLNSFGHMIPYFCPSLKDTRKIIFTEPPKNPCKAKYSTRLAFVSETSLSTRELFSGKRFCCREVVLFKRKTFFDTIVLSRNHFSSRSHEHQRGMYHQMIY